jgi:hypothetical protein
MAVPLARRMFSACPNPGLTPYEATPILPFRAGQRQGTVKLLFGFERDIVLTLDLAFETKLLRTICETQIEAERRYGITVARMLMRRLADLSAARTD